MNTQVISFADIITSTWPKVYALSLLVTYKHNTLHHLSSHPRWKQVKNKAENPLHLYKINVIKIYDKNPDCTWHGAHGVKDCSVLPFSRKFVILSLYVLFSCGVSESFMSVAAATVFIKNLSTKKCWGERECTSWYSKYKQQKK